MRSSRRQKHDEGDEAHERDRQRGLDGPVLEAVRVVAREAGPVVRGHLGGVDRGRDERERCDDGEDRVGLAGAGESCLRAG